MNEFTYALVRYVPDPDRMEPINVGIILQGQDRLDLKLNPNVVRRKEIDTQVFQQWRSFLTQEIRGKPMPLFQPPKTRIAFLEYLSNLCEGSVLLSPPLIHAAPDAKSFDDILADLYLRLVAPPEATSPIAATRATGRFRQIMLQRQFEKRGLKKHAHVKADGDSLWMAYRQVDNGAKIAIDKIEVATQVWSTCTEIDRIPHVADLLPRFLEVSPPVAKRYVLLADKLKHPFTDQTEEEFDAMRHDLENAVNQVKRAGGDVLRSVVEVEAFAREIDAMLPAITDKAMEEQI
jgi:hypothetical protein